MAAVATVTGYETRTGVNLIRGTVPVPDNWTPVALHLRDSLGASWPTEQRVVVRGPAGNARVLELRATVTVDSPGGEQTYEVHEGSVPSVANVPANIAMTLACEDHAGTAYTATLLAAGPSGATAGAVTHEQRTYGELVSSGGVRMMGFDAYITTIAGEPDIFLVNMTVQNGTVGVSPILHELFFNELRLTLPADYAIKHMRADNHTSTTHLITSLGDGTMHVLLQGNSHTFRFAVHRTAAAGRASVLLEYSGFFVCDFSKTLWSWSNPATAWYGPQAEIVPAALNLSGYFPYGASFTDIATAMESGAALLAATMNGGKGPWYPRGPTDGGVQGGGGITGFTGYEVINSGSVDHLMALFAVEKMDRDRQRGTCIVGADQLPIDCADWDLSGIKFIDMGKFNVNHQGPFPRLNADQWRLNAVIKDGQLPWYYSTFNNFNPYKFSHAIRGLGAPFALAWLLNDPIAKTHIGNIAPWDRMLTLEYGNGDLFGAYQQALSTPGKGAQGFGGRPGGWSIVCQCADWMLADDSKRTGYAPWLTMLGAFYATAQLPSGGWMALDSGTPVVNLETQWTLNGYQGVPGAAASQAIEIGINAQGLRALQVCTGNAAIPGLFRNLCSGLFNYHWKPGEGAPHFVSPVRVQGSYVLPAYATKAAAPDCFTDLTDNYQIAQIIIGGLRYHENFPAAWSAIYAMTGTSTPEAAIADLRAQMPEKMAEGWGALLAFIEDIDYSGAIVPSPAIVRMVAVRPSVVAPEVLSPSPADIYLSLPRAAPGSVSSIRPSPAIVYLTAGATMELVGPTLTSDLGISLLVESTTQAAMVVSHTLTIG